MSGLRMTVSSLISVLSLVLFTEAGEDKPRPAPGDGRRSKEGERERMREPISREGRNEGERERGEGVRMDAVPAPMGKSKEESIADVHPPATPRQLTLRPTTVTRTHAPVSAEIDRAIDAGVGGSAKLSPRTTDEEFLRRVYMDITGRIPSARQAAAFLDSRDAGKRAKLIDELLESPNYGRHFATGWTNLIMTTGEPVFNTYPERFEDLLADNSTVAWAENGRLR